MVAKDESNYQMWSFSRQLDAWRQATTIGCHPYDEKLISINHQHIRGELVKIMFIVVLCADFEMKTNL